MKRALLTTIGTHGDFYPVLALARELRSLDFDVTIGAQEKYKDKVLEEEFSYLEQLPSWEIINNNPELLKKIYHPKEGAEFLFNELILPSISKNLENLLNAGPFDLVFTTTMTFATKIAADKWKVPCVSLIFSPISLFSVYDPPQLPFFPILNKLNKIKYFPIISFYLMDLVTGKTRREVNKLRLDHKLSPLKSNPLIRGYSRDNATLALLPDYMLPRQRDWSEDIDFIGFPYLSELGEKKNRDLIIYTMGSSLLDFDQVFFESARKLHANTEENVLFIVGDNDIGICSPNIKVMKEVPYSEVFSSASVVIHQGGIGTIAEAMRAGVPQIICPTVNDQLENAQRCKNLGVAKVIDAGKVSANSLREAILNSKELTSKCESISELILKNNFSQNFKKFLTRFLS